MRGLIFLLLWLFGNLRMGVIVFGLQLFYLVFNDFDIMNQFLSLNFFELFIFQLLVVLSSDFSFSSLSIEKILHGTKLFDFFHRKIIERLIFISIHKVFGFNIVFDQFQTFLDLFF